MKPNWINGLLDGWIDEKAHHSAVPLHPAINPFLQTSINPPF
jgi:hypothetical protein